VRLRRRLRLSKRSYNFIKTGFENVFTCGLVTVLDCTLQFDKDSLFDVGMRRTCLVE
ncbi:hypothetical protein THOM_1233, partial [Trachipleistophora hominis]